MGNAFEKRLADFATALRLIQETVKPDDVCIFSVRHGQKQDDNLTPIGERQIEEAVWQIAAQVMDSIGRKVEVILTSGKNRTAQAAAIAQEVLGIEDLVVEQEEGLNPFQLINEIWHDDRDGCLREMREIRAVHDTVAYARTVSAYARRWTETARQMLVRRAGEMAALGKRTAIGFGHSPATELGATDQSANEIPYGIEEAAGIFYVIRKGEIVLSVMILGPIEGARN